MDRNTKRRTLRKGAVSAALQLFSTVSLAQTSLTLYGVLDAGIRYQTHGVSYAADGTPLSAGNKVSMTNGGGLAESYWGLKGQEDLGGGNQALFDIESHFDPGSGAITPFGSENFFEISYVGLLSPTLGQLTFGRQYNVAFEGVTLAYGSNSWTGDQDPYVNLFKPEQTVLGGARTSNMIHYGAQLGDVVILAQYAPGGQAGGGGAGSQFGGSLSYAPDKGPIKLGVSFLRSRDDVTNGKFDIYTGGGSFTVGKFTINAGYIQNDRDNDFTSFGNGPYSATDLAALGIISPQQVVNPASPGGFDKRQMILAGLAYRVTPSLTLAANGWWTRQTGYTADFNGRAQQYQVVGGYALSKRDMLYAEADYSIYRGGLIGAQLVGINGQAPTASTTQLGVMVGLRHYF
ncbi:Outer membrane protein (porin) [Paraburkholderia steynii]|uniref:Outer membrane protein (Porin) n=1 Tax=Paraburkholderia steynii TaxID=1245441 RepID=A0A7Z7BAW8_9BURK|nr:porin [Paraburkholderia steynii]SDI49435.1 Outer membrane protein (porin) [Paraburkholderia steynii]